MRRLVEIRSELFPRLYESFLHDDDPLSDEEDWRNVFDYQWKRSEEHTGYALVDGEAVVGMMAMAFKERMIDGERRKFCNLHTWWVHPDHRGHSAAMLRPLLALKDYTITHFTPCDRVRGLLKRLGFVALDQQMTVLGPPRAAHHTEQSASIAFDDDIDRTLLDEHERELVEDHEPYDTGVALLREGGRHCLVLYTVVERYRVRYCHIHHFGSRALFERHEEALRRALMRRHAVRLVMLDARRVGGMRLARSINFWAPAHAIYRPAGNLTPAQVDNLYSDVVMLKLATMPHLRHEIERIVRSRIGLGEVPA